MKKTAFTVLSSLVCLLLATCSDPVNPFQDPKIVRINLFIQESQLIDNPDTTFFAGDTVYVGLAVLFGNLVDTCLVSMDAETTFTIAAGGIDNGDTVWCTHPFSTTGSRTVRLYAVLKDGSLRTDSIRINVIWRPYTFSATFGLGNFTAGIQTADGAYYIGGQAGSQGALLKLTPGGVEEKRYLPSGVAVISDLLPCIDSGIVACGTTGSNNGWLAKIDETLNSVGNILDQGSAREDRFATMTAKRDNAGFIAAGEYNWDRTWSTGDAWFVTVDANAAFLRQKTHGGPARDYIADITQAANAGYFFVGTYFPTSTSSGLAWIGKITESGDTLAWSKTFSSPNGLGFSSVIMVPDGGAYCAGSIMVAASASSWMPNGYIMRVNASGDSIWTRQHGVAGQPEYFAAITRAHDGGYICAGLNGSKGWLLKIDENGNRVWEKLYPENGNGFFYSIARTAQNGYLCTGNSGGNAWVVRTDANGNHD